MRLLLFFFSLGMLWLSSCRQDTHVLRLAPPFGDHMVLQQQAQAPIWGWASPRQAVNLTCSWLDAPLSTRADAQGRWQTTVSTPAAGGPYTLTVQAGEETRTLEDVLIGEVWLAGGQSNMEWPLSQSDSAAAAVAAARHPQIRFFHVAHAMAARPQDTCSASWQVCEPEAAASFSAVAYYFGRNLHQELDVPIGLIGSYWGGTPAQAWISSEGFQNHPDLRILHKRFEADLNAYLGDSLNEPNPLSPSAPTALYNGMIAPLTPFKIRGAIWYQGEANVPDPYLYRILFPTLIQNWREAWGGTFPFYYVQITPYSYPIPFSAAGLREAQMMTLSLPRTGMVVTLDVGDPLDNHPRDKRTVGERLARWALQDPYGRRDEVTSGPLYESMQVEGRRVQLFFTHTAGKLINLDGPLTDFRIAGPDRDFFDAQAEIVDDTTVVVSSPQVADPRSVRFAFTNTAQPNLFNQAGLPASSFRTDDWPMIFSLPRIHTRYDREADEFEVWMENDHQATALRYTLDGSTPSFSSSLYTGPLRIREASLIKARAFQENFAAEGIAEKELLRHLGMQSTASLKQTPSPKYPGGGALGLIDGLGGTTDFLDPAWQGYEGENFEVMLDLGESIPIHEVKLRFLQNQGAWIFLPQSLTISLSSEGNTFEEVWQQKIEASVPNAEVAIFPFSADLSQQKARFIRIHAYGVLTCPEWHAGAGGKTWIFIDEVIVN